MKKFQRIYLKGISPEARQLYCMLRQDYGMSVEQARMTIFGICVAHDPDTLETRLEEACAPEPEPLELYYRASSDDEWELI